MFACLRQGFGGQAGKDGREILAHLLCCAGLAVCLYSGTPRAAHLRQTDAMQESGSAGYNAGLGLICPADSLIIRPDSPRGRMQENL